MPDSRMLSSRSMRSAPARASTNAESEQSRSSPRRPKTGMKIAEHQAFLLDEEQPQNPRCTRISRIPAWRRRAAAAGSEIRKCPAAECRARRDRPPQTARATETKCPSASSARSTKNGMSRCRLRKDSTSTHTKREIFLCDDGRDRNVLHESASVWKSSRRPTISAWPIFGAHAAGVWPTAQRPLRANRYRVEQEGRNHFDSSPTARPPQRRAWSRIVTAVEAHATVEEQVV